MERDTDRLLDALEVVSLLQELGLKFEPAGDSSKILCPFHSNTDTPACVVFHATRRFRCYSCGMVGDVFKLAAQVLGKPRHVVVEHFKRKLGLSSAALDPVEVENWHQALMGHTKYLELLTERKGLTLAEVARRKIGVDRFRVTIPIYDENGSLINVRRYNPEATGKQPKYTNARGCGEARLYPVDQLQATELVITEGEFKALALIARGVPAVTGTAGATTWRPEWTTALRGKRVALAFDVDAGGTRGARRVAAALRSHVQCLRVLRLPLDVNEYPTGGVEDWLTAGGGTVTELKELIRSTPEWQPPGATSALPDDLAVDVHLAEATRAEHYRRRVRVRVVVSAKDTAPFLVPAAIEVTCDRDQTYCAFCPIFAMPANAQRVELAPDSESTLKLLDVPDNVVNERLKEAASIPRACKVSGARAVATRTVEEVRLIPQLSTSFDREDPHAVTRSYFVGHGLEPNAAYAMEGRLFASSKTQHSTLLFTEAVPDVDDLATFELSSDDREALRVFRPTEWTTEALEAKLRDLYTDLEANVTGIFGRHDAHLLADLVWHSVLYVQVQGRRAKGWVDALLLGDAGQGKSEIAERLRQHYGLGERVECKGASTAGLVGGLQDTGGRWWLQWGVIPLNDRRLVVLEEAKGLSVEDVAKLTDVRSSGVAEIVKIERRRTHARTRLLWISNPRSRRALASYAFPVQALIELIGAPEDVRRFDVALAVGRGEVALDEINKPLGQRVSVEHRHVARACRSLLLWAWSRSVEQVEFEPAAETRTLVLAGELSERYTAEVPLVEPADQRHKIARLSAALATRTFSADEDGARVIVRECHVEAIGRFLDRAYDGTLGYGQFSRIRGVGDVFDFAAVEEALAKTPFPSDLVRAMLEADVISQHDLADWAGDDLLGVRDLTSLLVRKNALRRGRNGYLRTPAFVAWLRRAVENGGIKAKPTSTEF